VSGLKDWRTGKPLTEPKPNAEPYTARDDRLFENLPTEQAKELCAYFYPLAGAEPCSIDILGDKLVRAGMSSPHAWEVRFLWRAGRS
jgi:hypothetical protein